MTTIIHEFDDYYNSKFSNDEISVSTIYTDHGDYSDTVLAVAKHNKIIFHEAMCDQALDLRTSKGYELISGDNGVELHRDGQCVLDDLDEEYSNIVRVVDKYVIILGCGGSI